MPDRTITIPASYMGEQDATLTLDTPDGERGNMTLELDGCTIAAGEDFRAASFGPSLLEMSDGELAGMFGGFLAHALESSEEGARAGWSILSDDAAEWTDALALMDEDSWS